MIILRKFRETAEIKAIESILKMLPKMNEKDLIKTTYLVERLPYDEGIKSVVKIVREYFQQGHPCVKPDVNLIPTPQQRNKLRERLKEVRATLPLFVRAFWNDGPFVQGCIAGARQYVHINNKGNVEPCVFCHFAVDNVKSGKSLKEIFNSPFFKRCGEKFNGYKLLLLIVIIFLLSVRL